jgi:hypothetical protein
LKKAAIIALVILSSVASATDIVKALIQVESKGNDLAVGDNGRAVGCLQIWEVVIKDVNRVYHTNYKATDRTDRKKSIQICRKYLVIWGKHYEKVTGKKCTLEVLARIWNGGPNGWKKDSTIKYWNKVKKELK